MISVDALVVGTGGVGSAALAALARRGVRAIGIDRYDPPHDRGSSHGRTRIIRQAYFEHPDYVPLVLRAFELWRALEERTGATLYSELGLLQAGPAEGTLIPGVRASADLHGLPLESLSAGEVATRFPGICVPEALVAVYESRAGILRVEACVAALLDDARRAGAVTRANEPVVAWSVTGGVVEVRTERETYQAARAIVTAGPWAASLLGELELPLVVRRKAQFWYEAPADAYRVESPCPAFLFELPEGAFYGMPAVDERGVKLAEHSGGRAVSDPATVDRAIDPGEESRLARFAATCLPRLSGRRTDHAVCMYTLTPDEHFIVDRHPRYPQVALAAGLSGHGFKFVGVLGEALADLALEGTTDLPIGFLGLDRPALRPA